MKIINIDPKYPIYKDIQIAFEEHFKHNESKKVLILGITSLTNDIYEDLREQHPDYELGIWQCEQLSVHSPWADKNLFGNLSRADFIVDMCPNNMLFYKDAFPSKSVTYLPMPYSENLIRLNQEIEQDIDLLFIGSVNERRWEVLNSIQLRFPDLNIKIVTNNYNQDELDRLIERSKIFLNVHYYNIFSQEPRILLPMMNNRLVLSERSCFNSYGKGIIECHKENIPDFIEKILEEKLWDMKTIISPTERFKNAYEERVWQDEWSKHEPIDLN